MMDAQSAMQALNAVQASCRHCAYWHCEDEADGACHGLPPTLLQCEEGICGLRPMVGADEVACSLFRGRH